MHQLFGDAVWIGSSHPFDLHEVYLDLSSPPVLGVAGESADLLISADSRYRLWLNGKFVGRGPSRSYPEAQSVDHHDLSNYWIKGTNQIAVQVYQPGYSHFSYVHQAAAGMLAALKINGEIKLVSDGSWHVRRNPSFAGDVPRISIYGSGIEVRDLNFEDRWEISPPTENWDQARVVSGPAGPIWNGLRKRDTPQTVEREAPFKLVESRIASNLSFEHVANEDIHGALAEAWQLGTSVPAAEPQNGWVAVPSSSNSTLMWLYDLGRAYTCQGWAEIKDATGNEQLLISYADKFKDGELVISNPSTYCRVRPTDKFKLRPGRQTAESFSMRGGRYVMFLFSGVESETFAFRPHLRVAEYPLNMTKPLVTADDRLNKIITMCENTFKACLQDSFVDCVWRESSQWLGDGLVQSKILASITDDLSLVRKLLHDTAVGQDAQGFIPSIAPGQVYAYDIPRYGCMWVECLAFYLRQTDDVALVYGTESSPSTVWKAFLNFIEYMVNRAPRCENGLFLNPAGRRHYIDWSMTSQKDPHCVTNLHIILALQEAAWLASNFGLDQGSVWQAEADKLKALCRKHFWHEGVWHDDLERSTHSQLAAALALRVGCVETDEQADLIQVIIDRSLDLNDEHAAGEMVLASPFMHHYLFETLHMFGHDQAIIEIINGRWGRWVDQGYVTTWENWNVDFPDGSECHAFSAHPRHHLAQASIANVSQ